MDENPSGADGRMAKKMRTRTRTRTRRVIVVRNCQNSFSIDEDDYNIINDQRIVKQKVTNDGAFRVYEFKSQHSLPHNVGDLDHLRSLDLRQSDHSSMPASIGKLKRLKLLKLDCSSWLSNLPEEIGSLVALEELTLSWTRVKAIPSSIGNLQNLRRLNLLGAEQVSSLPEEIGDLVSLEDLIISETNITSLPSSIGKLQNLKKFRANLLEGLGALPEEIGNLHSLEYLSLKGSRIASLPSSICRLKNLRLLSLRRTKQLSDLPTEIGNLTNLVYLDLKYSKVSSFPTSFGELKNLQYLEYDTKEPLIFLKRHPLLVHTPVKLRDARALVQLGRNRLRLHVSEMERTPGLWPYMLKNAKKAFELKSIKKPSCVKYHIGHDPYDYSFLSVFEMTFYDKVIGRYQCMDSAHAIYELLTVGRDAFIRALVARNKDPQ